MRDTDTYPKKFTFSLVKYITR